MTFNKLFAGNEERYLTFNPKTLAPRDGDAKMKPDYRTISQTVDTTPEQWAVTSALNRPLIVSARALS